MLVACVICATAATGALVIAVLVGMPPGTPPPGPNGMPPPPPDLQPLAVLPIITGLFVLAWLAVIVVFSRDQLLARIREIQPEQADQERLRDLFAELRAELATDREQGLQLLGERLAALTAEYGEQRETDGYLNGMRVATASEAMDANVRSIRRTPPPR